MSQITGIIREGLGRDSMHHSSDYFIPSQLDIKTGVEHQPRVL